MLTKNLGELAADDPEISTISSKSFTQMRKPGGGAGANLSSKGVNLKHQNNAQWHSDITFEPVPADYTSLRLIQLPETGGG